MEEHSVFNIEFYMLVVCTYSSIGGNGVWTGLNSLKVVYGIMIICEFKCERYV